MDGWMDTFVEETGTYLCYVGRCVPTYLPRYTCMRMREKGGMTD